ncbi:phosphate signaling complex protein PhoU [uncultured Ferrovibrio sp.]|jgi:phosphate transport system protein|uniref:phosphate signaling complex protein PhoU n=1 Tax=uncultured Ferrovibrio sp. TaxID=1576913 RepID=UPI0026356EB6|nr:phosphate signaling complex protein PhoU [uncultured Ferrovibrio sp.]
MPTQHIVQSFDDELRRLATLIVQMGGLAEQQLASAVEAVVRRDSDLATEVVQNDAKLDTMRTQIDDLAIELLARRQPLANDLRTVVSALRISSEIERIGDYAKNVAKRSIALNQAPLVKPVHAIPRMAALVQALIKDTLDAYITADAAKADAVWARDEEVDELYTSLFRELLTYMMEDPRSITACTHLLFIAKNIERIGDHATNIAELIHYTVKGEMKKEERPKGDDTAYAVVTAPGGRQ